MFVYDQLDILTFVQETGTATVEAFDAEIDDVTTSGRTTNVLDLEVASPNYHGQSIYVVPRKDAKGGTIGGTGNPKIVATLKSGSVEETVTTTHAVSYQAAATEALEIPIPQEVGRFIAVSVASNGGGATNAINAGAIQVYIGRSGMLG